jgi:hypothetical protein
MLSISAGIDILFLRRKLKVERLFRLLVIYAIIAIRLWTTDNWNLIRYVFEFSYIIEGATEKVHKFHTTVSQH